MSHLSLHQVQHAAQQPRQLQHLLHQASVALLFAFVFFFSSSEMMAAEVARAISKRPLLFSTCFDDPTRPSPASSS
ncbi:hypothetical protein GBA52_029138 [Prunus armeniaca]|nr:hypothetical protein GBA52_029138 [Prunus armeniaca]